MLSYILASLAGAALTLGSQGAAKAIRSRGGAQPMEYATRVALNELGKKQFSDREALRKDIASAHLEFQRQQKDLTTSMLEEIKIESNARQELSASLAELSQSVEAERESLLFAGGIATRMVVSKALEELHRIHLAQEQALAQAINSVARQLEVIVATASFPANSSAATPPPSWLPPLAPGLRQAEESLFPEGVATVPLRPLVRPTADSGQDLNLEPGQILAGLQALRGMSGVAQ
jgi:hypothetical protein